jgi:hypothetical protein
VTRNRRPHSGVSEELGRPTPVIWCRGLTIGFDILRAGKTRARRDRPPKQERAALVRGQLRRGHHEKQVEHRLSTPQAGMTKAGGPRSAGHDVHEPGSRMARAAPFSSNRRGNSLGRGRAGIQEHGEDDGQSHGEEDHHKTPQPSSDRPDVPPADPHVYLSRTPTSAIVAPRTQQHLNGSDG